jgi:hypothetical protein
MHCGLAFSDHEDDGLDFSDFDEDDLDEVEDDYNSDDDDDDDDDDDGEGSIPGDVWPYNGPFAIDEPVAWVGTLYDHDGPFTDEEDEGRMPLWHDEADEEDGSENSDSDSESDSDDEDSEDEEDDSFIDSRSETEILAAGGELDSDISIPYNVRPNNFYTQPDSSINHDDDDEDEDEDNEIPARRSRRVQRVAVDTDEETEQSDDTIRNTTSASTTTESSSSQQQQAHHPAPARSTRLRRTRNAIYISDED